MEIKSENNHNRRQRGNQSGGGNRNRNQQGNRNRNRSGSRNRSGGGGGNRSGGGGGGNRNNNRNRNRNRRSQPPKQTKGQKILSFLTFGLLGKPKHKPTSRTPKSQGDRAPQSKKTGPPREKKPRQKRTRNEVTSGRLYVGNLVYDANESDLEELFRGAGNVISAEVVTNSRTQQSKGFAFVEMGSIDEAKRAVSILDDEDFRGRKLIVGGARSEGPHNGDEASSGDSSKKDLPLEDQPTQPIVSDEDEKPALAESDSEKEA